jgi:hypothetical protein
MAVVGVWAIIAGIFSWYALAEQGAQLRILLAQERDRQVKRQREQARWVPAWVEPPGEAGAPVPAVGQIRVRVANMSSKPIYRVSVSLEPDVGVVVHEFPMIGPGQEQVRRCSLLVVAGAMRFGVSPSGSWMQSSRSGCGEQAGSWSRLAHRLKTWFTWCCSGTRLNPWGWWLG